MNDCTVLISLLYSCKFVSHHLNILNSFFNCKGIQERLSYLKELGVDVIWLSPIQNTVCTSIVSQDSESKSILCKFFHRIRYLVPMSLILETSKSSTDYWKIFRIFSMLQKQWVSVHYRPFHLSYRFTLIPITFIQKTLYALFLWFNSIQELRSLWISFWIILVPLTNGSNSLSCQHPPIMITTFGAKAKVRDSDQGLYLPTIGYVTQ